MAKGYALIIGLNRVDKKHYDGWDGKLNVCEKDVIDFAAFFKKKKSLLPVYLQRMPHAAMC